jgi:hypothetical protein
MEGPDGDSQAGMIKVQIVVWGYPVVSCHHHYHTGSQHAERGFGWSPRKIIADEMEIKQKREEGALYVFQITTIDQ